MSIKNAFTSLKNGIADLTTVEVHTFSGDISATLNTEAEGSLIDWTTLIKNAKNSGSLTLMAASKYEFDGDAQQIVNPAITAEMQEAHNAAVAAGLEVRQSLIDTFYDVINVVD